MDANFREIYHRIIYIEFDEETAEAVREQIDLPIDATGVFAYGYAEGDAGMCFLITASAVMPQADTSIKKIEGCADFTDGKAKKPENGTGVDGPYIKKGENSGGFSEQGVLQPEIGMDFIDEYCRIRYGDISSLEFTDMHDSDVISQSHIGSASAASAQLEKADDVRRVFLDWELLDSSRNVEAPHFVSVVLRKAGIFPELAWVKCKEFADGNMMIGELAAEPRQNFGVHSGEDILFSAYDTGGGIQLFAELTETGKIATVNKN